jgi:Spy/CpxP family protein refolding chaperone
MMKIKLLGLFLALMSGVAAWAQQQTVQRGSISGRVTTAGPKVIVYRGEMGKWWQNSEISKQLQLSDSQIAQLDQIFYDHKVKLIDYGAEMEKQDLKLQTLLDADIPNQSQVEAQVDQVLTSRGSLEREYTMMNLDLRRVLSLEQWRQLRSIRGEQGLLGDKVFFHKVLPPGAKPGTMPLPPGAMPPPPLPPDEMY